ncbi:MAG: TetR/AcrR family transcriptional regulator [Turicibacter sp.]
MGKESKNELSRERILNAALEEFGQNDYNSASTNAMCKNHQISKGLLFHYYKNKEELFLQCAKKCFEELNMFLQNNYVKTGSSVEQNLNHYFEVRFKFFEEYPYYAQIFRTSTFNAPSHLIKEINTLKMNLRQTNELILLDMIQGVCLKEEIDKEEVVHTILEFADYLQVKQRIKSEEIDHQKATKVMIEEQNLQLIKMINILFYGILN